MTKHRILEWWRPVDWAAILRRIRGRGVTDPAVADAIGCDHSTIFRLTRSSGRERDVSFAIGMEVLFIDALTAAASEPAQALRDYQFGKYRAQFQQFIERLCRGEIAASGGM